MLVLGISSSVLALAGTAAGYSAQLPPRHLSIKAPEIVKRVESGGACGPGVGVCDEGFCCSAGGVCGVGGQYCSSPGCQLSYGPACHGNIVPKGADTTNTPRPHFGDVPYGIDLRSCSVPGTMAITFDDGPYHYTNELLDLLSKLGARVTFFVTGMNGAKGPINEPSTGQPDTLRRMIAEGHQIAAHSWSHEDMESITPEQKHDQIVKNEIALADIFGFFPTYYRPPYTGCGVDCIGELGGYGYHVTNYNLDTKDWRDGVDQARLNYEAGVDASDPYSAGIIALAHDIHASTVHELTQFMVDKARMAGYELVTIGECFGDPPGNWYRDAKTGQPIGNVAVQKGSQKGKAKAASSGTSRTATPIQPSSGASAHSTNSKVRPGGEAKTGKGNAGNAEFDNFIFDDDYSQGASSMLMGIHSSLYAIVALFVGMVAML